MQQIHHSAYIHPTAVIGPNVTIEADVYIGPLCVIGMPPEWKGKEGEDKGVIISYGTRITGLVTIDSGAEDTTFVGENCYLMKHSHIGHDAMLFPNVTISCGVKVGGHAVVGDGSNIGLNACIHQRAAIPYGCMIGMGTIVTKKTEMKPNRKYAGVPARDIGENVRP